MEVLGEYLDSVLHRRIGQFAAQLVLDRRKNQPVIRVLGGGAHRVGGGAAARLHDRLGDDIHAARTVEVNRHFEEFFAFAPVDGENFIARRALHRLAVFVIIFIHRLGLGVGGPGNDAAVFKGDRAQALADLGVVGNILRDDVECALQGFFRGVDFLFGVEIRARHVDGVFSGVLRENRRRQRFQPLFTGNGGAGLALGLIGAVDILNFGERGGVVKRGHQLIGELAEILDRGAHLRASLVEILQIFITLGDFAQLLVVHRAVHLLAVPRDKGNGVAVVDQFENIFAVFGFDLKFIGKGLCKIHFISYILLIT